MGQDLAQLPCTKPDVQSVEDSSGEGRAEVCLEGQVGIGREHRHHITGAHPEAVEQTADPQAAIEELGIAE